MPTNNANDMAQLLGQLQSKDGQQALMHTLMGRLMQNNPESIADTAVDDVASGNTDPSQFNHNDLMRQLLANAMNSQNNEVVEKKKRRQKEIRRMREHLLRVSEEHDAMSQKLNDLALACGACPDCWGEFQHCNTCQGHGVPGYFKPDQEAWQYYVQPSLYALGLLSEEGQRTEKPNINVKQTKEE